MEGYYDLEARLAHHKPVTKQIQVVAGQSQEISLNPTPIYGSLDIISTPRDATITIDGKPYGKTPFTIEQLLEGEHTVVISKEGYSVFKKVVNITEDNTETVSATMEEGIQLSNNDGDSSIKLVGRLTKKEWERLKELLKDNNISSVDLSQAECGTIPWGIFSGNNNIITITLPNSVTSIGVSAFSGCRNLISITIPNSVTSIGNRAFADCTNLTSITIPNSVTSIGESAFDGCKNLASIIIPNSVTSIEVSAFRGTKWLDSQPSGVVYAGRVAYKYNGEMPSGTRIILKDGTIAIASFAFCYCRDLTSITIPNSVTSIGESAFSGCKSLTSITIPNSVTSIGKDAFADCSNLTSITIPNSVTSIGDGAFRGTKWLDSQPSGVVYAGRVAYTYEREMRSETRIILKDGTVAIADGAFGNSYSMFNVTSITIPNSVTEIGYQAFTGCSKLTSIEIPNSVTSIGESAFRGCKNLASIIIPNSVTSIGESAFYDTKWLNSQPSGVVYAGRVAYTYNGEVPSGTRIILKEGTIGIVDRAFYDHTNQSSITIPNSVTSIGFNACGNFTVYVPKGALNRFDKDFIGAKRIIESE